MLKNTFANNWIKCLSCAFIFSYLFAISRTLHLRDYADDQFFLAIFNSGDVISKAFERYFTWTGRVPIEILMTSTIGYQLFWKLGIPFAVLILCFSICRLSYGKVNSIQLGLAVLLFASIPTSINEDASWWVTGFYNYLLPVSLAFYAFSVNYLRVNSKIERSLCFLSLFFFIYMEQAGLAYILALSLMLYVKRDTRNAFNFIVLIVAIANFIVCIKAPGNENRMFLEAWTWYPQYQTYGITNKLSLGFDKLHQLMTMQYNIPLALMFFILVYFRSTLNNIAMKLSVKISMLVLISYIVISIANSFTGYFYTKSFFFNDILSSSIWSSSKIFFSYFYIFMVISSLFTVMLEVCLEGKRMYLPPVFMLLGFMTVTMMGLSPTVYASGLRVDFIFECMCIAACASMSKTILDR